MEDMEDKINVFTQTKIGCVVVTHHKQKNPPLFPPYPPSSLST